MIILEGLGIYYGKFARTQRPEPSTTTQSRNIDEKTNQALRQKLNNFAPTGLHIVIDTAQNRLYLKKGATLIREAVISSGSGSKLEDPEQNREWVFDTPRGVFSVKSKQKNPLWVKPDWAYIEEGKRPPKNKQDRFESGVLGDYALGFGDGYFIHGTLYSRLLGRNVSHGCVRVGDKDLQAVYAAAAIGTKIYIF
ncbi:MAG: hypothetical protein A2V90_04165 [Gammaproteobacteria bacterium RBG_16_57_12]|nr:MAG: hypothetical protein A2V90_04165 [Gammaproteobacteria bacterium RBG_16_57_12]